MSAVLMPTPRWKATRRNPAAAIKPGYFVLHMADKRGPIESVIDDCLADKPYALTSQNFAQRFEAAQPMIFVIESSTSRGYHLYRLGYCFRVSKVKPITTVKGFDFRLSGEIDDDFKYFQPAAPIGAVEVVSCLKGVRGLGLKPLPEDIMRTLHDRLKG